MLDIEILKFYNSIKDPSWPTIQSYLEFCNLPEHIKTECNDIHGFQERKNQILDNNYWTQTCNYACVYENLAFIPITKCAYSYHTTLFTNLGWKRVPLNEIDTASTKFFGTVVHPMERWVKGIAEWIVGLYTVKEKIHDNPWFLFHHSFDWVQLTADLQTSSFKNLVDTTIIGDVHSMPYYSIYGNTLMDTANWIPMDAMTDNEVKISMMNFFKLHGHNIILPLNDQRLHVSTTNQREIQNIIKQSFLKNNNEERMYLLNRIFCKDLEFYYNLIETFDPSWQHLKI